MFEWYRNGVRSFASSQAKLLALDYLKKTGANSAIAYYDELFYVYFVWSLGEFTIPYCQGYIAEHNNMLFNPTAYIDDRQFEGEYRLHRLTEEAFRRFVKEALSPEVMNDILEELSFSWIDDWAFLTNNPLHYLPNDEPGYYSVWGRQGISFQTPNKVPRINPDTGEPFPHDRRETPIYTPSPLGHYYFELTDNLNTFVEYYPRIYPSITTPPKGWSKEMMKKLELELE